MKIAFYMNKVLTKIKKNFLAFRLININNNTIEYTSFFGNQNNKVLL